MNDHCKYCDRGEELAVKSTDRNFTGIVIRYPNMLVVYRYDVYGSGRNDLSVKINYCPMCGRKLDDVTTRKEAK